jgi:DNA-binding NtrC family response regulator
VPPLRERREDLDLLVQQLLHDQGRDDVHVTSEVLEWMNTRSWPGNVRELKNVLQYGLAFVDRAPRDAHGSPVALTMQHFASLPPSVDDETSRVKRLPLAGVRLAVLEQAAIEQTLARCGCNKMQAARILGIAVSTLYEKLKRYDIGDCRNVRSH